METTGRVIAGLTGTGILIVGVLYLFQPRQMAKNFGLPVIPAADATPWLRVKGVRDLATGIVAWVLILAATSTILGWALLAFAVIPLGDAALILDSDGSRAAAFGIHGLTVLLMLIGAVLLLAV